VNTIAIHEAAHVTAFLTYGVKSAATITSTTGLTQPEPNTLTTEQLMVCYVAGVCGEVLYGDRKVPTHRGALLDAQLICTLLGVDQKQAHGYSTAIALIAEGSKAHLIPPSEHIELLRAAIAEAKQTLARHQRVLKQITSQLEEHGSC
jgi:hypothetical protein